MLMQGSENEIEASNITYHSSDLQDNIIQFHMHGIAIRHELFLGWSMVCPRKLAFW